MSETNSSSPEPSRIGPPPSEVSISNTRQIDFKSQINGREYRIQVAFPRLPPPVSGYPVLYVLDGFAYFASAAEAVRSSGNAPSVLVVGIGYPLSTAWALGMLDLHFRGETRPTGAQAIGAAVGVARFYDLSLPADDAALAIQTTHLALPRQVSADVGGLRDFLRVVETEIKPLIHGLAKTDPDNQVLFGHSLGGLATLHALFVQPNAFRTFIAASPSIWWNQGAVLKSESGFSALVEAGETRPRVLVTMGELEDRRPAHISRPAGISEEVFAQAFERSRMVENGRELIARLKSLKGHAPFYVADYLVFPHQGHGISAWSALAAGIAFAFQGP